MNALPHQQRCCPLPSLRADTILIGLLNLLLDLTMTSIFILAIFSAQVSQKFLLDRVIQKKCQKVIKSQKQICSILEPFQHLPSDPNHQQIYYNAITVLILSTKNVVSHTLHIVQIDPLAIFHEKEQEHLKLSKVNEVTPGRK